MSRFARRIDTTHVPIRKALEAQGWSVSDTSRLGDNFPDLVVGANKRTILIECKSPTRKDGGFKPSALTDGQRHAISVWKGDAWLVVTGPEDAVDGVRDVLSRVG